MLDRTTAHTTVAASPPDVMAVIADLGAYPLWNDEVREVRVLATDSAGRAARARFVIVSTAFSDDYELAYAWQGDERASWSLVREASILSRLDGSYVLSSAAGGGTEVTYTLSVDVKVPMIGMLKRKAEKVLIDRALAGLRTRVEGRP